MKSTTTDGTQAPAQRSRRRVASAVGVLVALPVLIAGVVSLVAGWRSGVIALGPAFGSIAVAVTARLVWSRHEVALAGERSLRLEHALAAASGALLKRGVADPVGTALLALVDGVDANSVFLDSVGEAAPDRSGITATVRDVLRRTPSGMPAGWDLIPWRVTAAARKVLETGAAYVVQPERCDEQTAAMYRAARVASEIIMPITVEGSWVGNVGFGCPDSSRQWNPAERQLIRIGAEMIGVYWERRDAIGRLEALVAAKDEFIASVSHEVRTPLTAVLGFAHELNEAQGKFSQEEQADLIGLVAGQSQEVANIVDDLLIAARTDTGSIVIVPESVPISGVVGEVLSSHSGRVDFSMPVAEDLDVWADPVRLRQILRNLLTNAARYGGDVVKLTVLARDDTVVIEVRDNGEGIPEHLRDHVFEPYARAHKTATQPASVGLGLSVARKLTRLMDGDLVLSRQGSWTVFALTLPQGGAPSEPAVTRRRTTQPVGMP